MCFAEVRSFGPPVPLGLELQEILLVEVSDSCFSRYRCYISCEQLLLVEVSDAVTFWFRGAQDIISTTADDDRTVWKSSTFQREHCYVYGWVPIYILTFMQQQDTKKRWAPWQKKSTRIKKEY